MAIVVVTQMISGQGSATGQDEEAAGCDGYLVDEAPAGTVDRVIGVAACCLSQPWIYNKLINIKLGSNNESSLHYCRSLG